MGNPIFGAGMHHGIAIGVERGIKIGLALAAEATRQRRIKMATTALQVATHAAPAIAHAVRQYRADKASSATA